MTACPKIGQSSNDALRLFHEMQLANVVPNKVTMVSVLLACGDVRALGTWQDGSSIEVEWK